MIGGMFWDFAWRLLLAGVLGAVIGLDREYRAKEAGFRTHFLVALGSALFMIVSQYGFSGALAGADVKLDPSRVAAQVVSGIGFLGAGTIIFQKQVVRGLTTAAGLWATAGIGLAVGGGMYWVSVCATVLTLFGLEILTLLFKSLYQIFATDTHISCQTDQIGCVRFRRFQNLLIIISFIGTSLI